MKHFAILFFSLLLFSCVTRKDTIGMISECPEEGVCRFEHHKNTALLIKKDDLGSLYHQTEIQQGKTTLVYYYEQNKDQAYLDGHYIEEIHFEMDNSVFNKSFESLKPNKILFGVFCYCKGKAGYYEVEKASVSYDKKKKIISASISNSIENQRINSFEIQL